MLAEESNTLNKHGRKRNWINLKPSKQACITARYKREDKTKTKQNKMKNEMQNETTIISEFTKQNNIEDLEQKKTQMSKRETLNN